MSVVKLLGSRVRRLRRLSGRLIPRGAAAGNGRGVRIRDGKIEPPYSCELDVVDHCNLACLDCNHGSPTMKRRFVDPEMVYRDFSMLANVYRPKAVKVLGGEPLLHPNLVEVVEALRRSGICQRVILVTNGLHLSGMPEKLWDVISELEISIYPASQLDDAVLRVWRDKAIRHGVRLRVFRFDRLRATFAMRGFADSGLGKRVYQSCKLAHVWGCHSIRDGHLFRCPQSNCIPIMLGVPIEKRNIDGIEIRESREFLNDLYRFLVSREPLQSCRNCLGSNGILRAHGTAAGDDWLSRHDVTGEALVNYDKLGLSEAGIPVDDEEKTLLEEYSVG